MCATDEWEADLAAAEAIVERHWGDPADPDAPMFDDMVDPVPDNRGPAEVDIYVLEPGMPGPDRGRRAVDPLEGRGAVMPWRSDLGVRRAGAVLVSRDELRVNPDAFEDTVIHELFHIVQMALNGRLGDEDRGDAKWWVEATAEWAPTHYRPDGETAVHLERFRRDQKAPHSLADDDAYVGRDYDAYTWPLFMAQEVGAEAVFDVWHELGDDDRPTPESVLAAIEEPLSFADGFADYAVRMIGGQWRGDDVGPTFADHDPGVNPAWTLWLEATDHEHRLIDTGGRAFVDYTRWGLPQDADHEPAPAGVPGLGRRADVVSCARPADDGDGVMDMEVSADAELAGHADHAQLDVIVDDPDTGEHVRHAVDLDGDGIEVRGEEAHLVLSNHATDPDELVTGVATVDVGGGPCEPVGGVVHLRGHGSSVDGQESSVASTSSVQESTFSQTLFVTTGERDDEPVMPHWRDTGSTHSTRHLSEERARGRAPMDGSFTTASVATLHGDGRLSDDCLGDTDDPSNCLRLIDVGDDTLELSVGSAHGPSTRGTAVERAVTPAGTSETVTDIDRDWTVTVRGGRWLDDDRRLVDFSQADLVHPDPGDEWEWRHRVSGLLRVD